MASPLRSRSTVFREGYAPALAVVCLLGAGPTPARAQDRPASYPDVASCQDHVTPADLAADGRNPLGRALPPHDLYLEVFYGDRPTGRIARVRLCDGRLSATVEELGAVGLVPPANAVADPGGWIPLEALPGLAYRYERATQRLILHASPTLRPRQHLGYEPPPPVEVRRDPGWLLGYDVYARGLGGDYTLALASSLRWFGSFGALELSGVSRAGEAPAMYRRLETRWTYSDPRHMWTWTVGDLIAGGLAWTRPVRLGGVQWRRNFGVRPDLITLPMPRFSGEVTVPASLELYVDNVRQFAGHVQDGPFVVDALPRISGSGEASFIVTDALGRVTETTVPLYVDQQRLAAGLSDFSLEAGVAREGFAGEDDGYGRDPVGSASVRHGATNTLTLEAHAEGGLRVGLLGIGAVWSPAGRWGLVAGSYARSAGNGGGAQYTLGYQWNSRGYGVDVQTLRRGADFRDLGDVGRATSAAAPSLRRQDRVTAWLPIARGSLAFTWLRRRLGDGTEGRTVSASLTQTVARHLSVSASAFDDRDAGPGGGLTMSVPLGARLQAGASVRRSQDRTSSSVTFRRSAPYEGGWGWSVLGGDGPAGYAQAAAEVRGSTGEVRFGVDRTGYRTGSFVEAGGSVVLMDGRLFPSRRIHDAFAVVSTNGHGDVPILSENRLYGHTGSAGYLLVPDLRGWQRNRIAIDPDPLPADYRLGELAQTATPADRSGVLLRFDVSRVDPAIVTLLGPEGEPVPAGSRGRLVPGGGEIVVGFDGEAYIEDLSTDVVIELEARDVSCLWRVPATVARHARVPATEERYRPTVAAEERHPRGPTADERASRPLASEEREPGRKLRRGPFACERIGP